MTDAARSRQSGTARSLRDRFDCQECGMNVDGREFHPYWHCVLFKNGVDPRHLDPAQPDGPQEIDVERLVTAFVYAMGYVPPRALLNEVVAIYNDRAQQPEGE